MTKLFNVMMTAAAVTVLATAAHAEGLTGGAGISGNVGVNSGVGVNTGAGVNSGAGVGSNTGAGLGATTNSRTQNSATTNSTTTNNTTNNADNFNDNGISTNTGTMNSMSTQAGMSASDITGVQQGLIDRGYTLSADGVIGAETESAIRSFQRDNNLSVTGELDAATMNKLNLSNGSMNGTMNGSGTVNGNGSMNR